MSGINIFSNFTVRSTEVYNLADSDSFVFSVSPYDGSGGASFINHGHVNVQSTTTSVTGFFSYGTTFYFNNVLWNVSDGVVGIRTTASGASAYGYSSASWGPAFLNDGTFNVTSTAGSAFGVSEISPNDTLTNTGHMTVTAASGAVGFATGNGVNVINSGDLTVHGGTSATGISSSYYDSSFNNSGTITAIVDAAGAKSYGLQIYAAFGHEVIKNSGTITADYAINASTQAGGFDDVTNTGHLNGSVVLGDFHDQLINQGSIGGSVDLGQGADLYDGSQGTLTGILLGGLGDDVIRGGAGAETFHGDTGTSTGQDGADQIYGGGGDDALFGDGGDDFLDGGAGADVLDGGTGTDTASYVGSTAGVTLDFVNGVFTGDAAGDTFTSIERFALSPFADTFVGGSADDYVLGGSGSDHLDGGAGNDYLDGGTGADSLIGGLGDDTFVIDNSGDAVSENSGEGVDTVLLQTSAYTLSSNVENLIVNFAGAVSVTGNALDNHITGGAGSDYLDGGLGADTLTGGQGNDVYVIDNVGDVVVENPGEGTDTVVTGLSTYVLPSNIENLQAIAPGQTVTGNSLDNLFTLAPGVHVDGGTGTDTVTYVGAGAGIQLNVAGGGSTGAAAGDTFTSIEHFHLTEFADIFVAGVADSWVETGSGNDYIYGGAGVDTAFGGAGVDVFVLGGGNDVAHGGDDTDYIYGGDGDDTLYGDGGVDVLIGDAGNNTYSGGDGGDYIYDGAGAGVANGDAGNDIFVMGAGNDVAYGGDGQDYFYMGDGDDVMYGGAGVDVMLGEGGNDTFEGGTGVDYMFLGPGGATDRDTVIVDKIADGIAVANQFDTAFDVINLKNTGWSSFTDVQAHLSDYSASGGFIIITLDADTAVWLIGVTPTQLSAANFHFG